MKQGSIGYISVECEDTRDSVWGMNRNSFLSLVHPNATQWNIFFWTLNKLFNYITNHTLYYNRWVARTDSYITILRYFLKWRRLEHVHIYRFRCVTDRKYRKNQNFSIQVLKKKVQKSGLFSMTRKQQIRERRCFL